MRFAGKLIASPRIHHLQNAGIRCVVLEDFRAVALILHLPVAALVDVIGTTIITAWGNDGAGFARD
ncbi:hypothetical protein, partial [uncultured Mobiluncus sp.]|uniref:hypothetical protein n=1 Tax=uncultured Mobiluncus sp. TaxID=293425 RepID=UPI002639B811